MKLQDQELFRENLRTIKDFISFGTDDITQTGNNFNYVSYYLDILFQSELTSEALPWMNDSVFVL